MPSVGRNEPCPCGSGKKFKLCCLGKAPPAARRRFILLPLLLGLLGLGAGAYLGVTREVGTGVAVAAAGVIVAITVYFFRDPPSPSGKGDAAAINFGKR